MPVARYGYIRAIGAALLTFLLVLSLVACAQATPTPTPTPPPERPAKLAVEPPSGKAAAALKISGSEFLPDEEVEVVLVVGEIRHGLGTEKAEKIIADKAGKFAVDSGIPVRTPPGTYEVKAIGHQGSVAAFSLTVVP